MNAVYSGQKRWYFLRAILLLCWMATAVIGYHGFFHSHEFLSVPVAKWLPQPAELDMLLAILCFGLPILFFINRPKIHNWILLLAIIAYLLLCLLDVNRLQSYMTVYFAFLAVFFIANPRRRMKLLLIILTGTYFYSGLQKLNPDFAAYTGKAFWFYSLPIEYSPAIGYGFASLEVLLGLLLLPKLTRKFSCYLLLIMHLLILWKIGPLKADWNYIVWPWNLMMMACLAVVAFAPEIPKTYVPSNISRGFNHLWKHQRLSLILLLLFWVLPPLNFLDAYPNNLSFHLYTGNDLDGKIVIDTSEWKDDQKSHYAPYDLLPEQEKLYLELVPFSLDQRGIAIYAEKWVYREIYDRFCKRYRGCSALTYERIQAKQGK